MAINEVVPAQTTNPWTPHLHGAAVTAALVTVGAVGAAALDQARLDVAAAVVVGLWLLVVGMSHAHSAYLRCADGSEVSR